MTDHPTGPEVFPGNAKVAVNVMVAWEIWENLPETKMSLTANFPPAAAEKGVPDLASRSWHEYGVKSGFPRLHRTIRNLGVPISIGANAIAVERYPDLAKQLVADGHELVGHGYSQDRRIVALDAEEDREEVARCKRIVEEVTGQPPVGWSSQGGQRSPHTVDSLLQEGFWWTNDFRDSDYPQVVGHGPDGPLVAMPRTDEINDAMLFRRHGQPPSVYFELFRRSFDQLAAEADLGMNVVTVVAHPTYFGHPFGASVLEECIDYARRSGVAWIARRRDVAEVYRKAIA